MATAAFRAVGTAANTETTTLALVAPTLVSGDILFAWIVSRNNTALSPLEGGWALIYDEANTAAMQSYLAWRRAGSADSGATFGWTVAGTSVSLGALVAYSGVIQGGRPYTRTTISNNASSDNVTYATLTPASSGLIVAFGSYGEDLATADTFTGTDPTFAERLDASVDGTTTDASLYIHDGLGSGAATGARTCATASTTDAVSQGIFLDLISNPESGGASGEAGTTYARVSRTRAEGR